MGEGDQPISLLGRALDHIESTALFSVFYGEGRDAYDTPDVRGRTTHEAIFNMTDGAYRCPNSQQGYTGFSTWTRGLAWAICGFAEELELLDQLSDDELAPFGGREKWRELMTKAARAAADFYLRHTPTDGICYWDTGAPQLHKLGDYLDRPAEPCNEHEPVDSSASAIAAQGLFRLARYLRTRGEDEGDYEKAALVTAQSLFSDTYLSNDDAHQGLLLHSIYHNPNGWDHVPQGSKIANGESCMWGDYHLMELGVYLQRLIDDKPYHTFWTNNN